MILESAPLSGSGRPLLQPGEIERLIVDKVDLHFDEKGGPFGKVPLDVLEDGSVSLTSHRFIWLDMKAAPSAGSTLAIPLSAVAEAHLHASHVFAAPKLRLKVKVVAKEQQLLRDQVSAALAQKAWEAAPPPSTRLAPAPAPALAPVAASYSPLQAALVESEDSLRSSSLQNMGFTRERSIRAVAATQGTGVEAAVQWLLQREGDPSLDAPLPKAGAPLGLPGGSATSKLPSLGTGVAGILKREQLLAARTDTVLDQAFADLRGLMSSASELVGLAQRFREVLAEKAAKEGEGGEGGADWDPQLEADLLMMGIPSPVTRQMAGTGYLHHLARELADFLGPRVESSGGMMPLTDCYCLFNRARGTELISPDDLLAALQLLPEVFERLLQLTGAKDLGVAVTASDVAAALKVPLAVATEHLTLAEGEAVLCRDDGPEGLRFFRNFFADPQTVLVGG